jgi:hypothetical protein
LNAAEETVTPEQRRMLKLRLVSNALQLQVVRVVRFLGSTPQFQIFTKDPDGAILLGDASAILEQRKFAS